MKKNYYYICLSPFLIFPLLILSFVTSAQAQTDIHITGAQAGFPVAVPQLCDAGQAGDAAVRIPDVISKDLQISGLFKVLSPSSFVESPGKCVAADQVGYSDWSVIGAEGLVRGQVSVQGGRLVLEMYLHDVLQKRAVVGKRYEAELTEAASVAHRFSNEIIRYFTGEPGIFGTQLVYVSKVGRFKELFRMELDGSDSRQLTRDNGLAISPAWSPSGDRIVYTSYRVRQPDLYFISPSGGVPKRVTDRQGLELGAEFTKDAGSIIASASFSGISKVVLFDLKGKLIRKITSGDSLDVSPSLSPDGQQFAFCSNRGGSPQIYVGNTTSGAAKRISFTDSTYCTSPAWSPKGDKIAFICRTGGNQLYVSNTDGSQVTQITYSGDNEDPTWAPDGRFIAFSSNFGGGPKNIAIYSLLGGRPIKVSNSRSEDGQPTWSPVIK